VLRKKNGEIIDLTVRQKMRLDPIPEGRLLRIILHTHKLADLRVGLILSIKAESFDHRDSTDGKPHQAAYADCQMPVGSNELGTQLVGKRTSRVLGIGPSIPCGLTCVEGLVRRAFMWCKRTHESFNGVC
jgi:hypothetical protein